MSPPSHAELTAAVRREGAALAAAGRLGTTADVGGCPGWTVADLLVHTGRVYRRTATVVGGRRAAPVGFPPRPAPGTDPVDYLLAGLDAVVAALAEAPADAPVWNWAGAAGTAAFWSRRMAHESAVHRVDGQLAHGIAEPVATDLAVDGIAELLEVLVPRLGDQAPLSGLAGVLAVRSREGAAWTVALGPGGAGRPPAGAAADVTVRGTAADLLLALYNRVAFDTLEVTGDAALLRTWAAVVRV